MLIGYPISLPEKTEIIESKYTLWFLFCQTGQIRYDIFKNNKTKNCIQDDNGRELNAHSLYKVSLMENGSKCSQKILYIRLHLRNA